MKYNILKATLLLALVSVQGCSMSEFINKEQHTVVPKELSLTRAEYKDMLIGETRKLIPVFTPSEVTDCSVSFSSENESVATVSPEGVLTATGLGETNILVTSIANPDLKAVCKVYVTKETGFSVLDAATGDVVEGSLEFVKNVTGERKYEVFLSVHNSYDQRFSVQSSDNEVASVKLVDGESAFDIIAGQKVGRTEIKLKSIANPEIKFVINLDLKTTYATDVALSLNDDGSAPSKSLEGSVTISQRKKVTVVFTTNVGQNTLPENHKVHLSSNDPTVATVPSEGSFDREKLCEWFYVTMVDNPENVPETGPAKKAVITLTTDDGGYTAAFTVTAKCPALESIALNMTETEPIHAGDAVQLTAIPVPSDAYKCDIVWSSADESVATVDQTGLVTVKEDFAYDPENPGLTEIMIRASMAANPAKYSECKIKPYQYVPATGVMVTDQWGNRMRFTSQASEKYASGQYNYCMQYCAGGGKAGTTLFNLQQSWGKASPAVAGVDNVGSTEVYLTGTPYPYTYPTITDPEQPFYWGQRGNTRFSIPAEGYEDGSTSTGWAKMSTTSTAQRLFLGHTCKFYTGHSSSGGTIPVFFIFRYDPSVPNNTSVSKKDLHLGTFVIHVNSGTNGVASGNPSMKNEDGSGKVFNVLNPDGLPDKGDDPTPAKWTGPMPHQGVWYILNDDGTPGEARTWGNIPEPTELTEYTR